jgi:hypothetical protein
MMRSVLWSLIPLALLTGAVVSPRVPQTSPSAEEQAAITATALDYIDGWYTADVERMTRALHPDLAKRIVRTDPATGKSVLDHMGAETLIGYTRMGGGSRTPEAERHQDVTILDVFGNAACVKVVARDWIDYLHLGRVDGTWKIINVLWEMKPQG